MEQAMKKQQSTNQKQWTDTFPKISNAVDSLLFVKHLTNLALPTILFLRKILPESEFDNKIFEGMTLKVLKTGTRNANTEIIQTWLDGVYDALEKKYLKSMSLEVKDVKSNVSLEIYTINVMDNTESASMSLCTMPGQRANIDFREQLSNIQLQTVRLLQMCHSVTKSCLDLPPEVTLTMKLSYQENVPNGYHPFGYKPDIPAMPIFLKKTRTFEMGVINTNHHVIEFMNKTCLCDETILPKARKEKTTDDITRNSESPCLFTNAKQKSPKRDVMSSQNTSLSSITNQNDGEISSQCTDDYSQSDLVRCPCLSQIKTSVMYKCSGCGYWVHAECFGIRVTKVLSTINEFYCQICDRLNHEFDCPDLAMMKLLRASEQQKLAVKRRILGFSNRFDGEEVTFRKLERISGLSCHKTVMEAIVKDMVDVGVLIQQSGDVYRINKKKVVEVMPEFFHTGCTEKRPIQAPPKTPQLGKRKMEQNDGVSADVSTPRIMPSRIVKKYLR